MSTRMTRSAAAAALDAATVALPSSPDYALPPAATKRAASGSKLAAVRIAEDMDQGVARPGSPIAAPVGQVLLPRSQAKQLIAKERAGMRASSNKENVRPEGEEEVQGQLEAITTVVEERGNTTVQEESVEARVEDNTVDKAAEGEDVADEDKHNLAPEQLVVVVEDVKDESDIIAPPAVTKPANTPRRVSQAANTRRTSTATKPAAERRTSTAVIPHSKPRPMSMSFPTPPPPAKSSKPATRPTFALPGEAVAAKLKAAKEARAAKEASSTVIEKKPAFKARPAPKMAPDATKVRQTAASRAREGLMHPGRRESLAQETSTSARRASSVLERRASMAAAAATKPARQSMAPTTTTSRQSLSGGPVRSDKGREVYNRAAQGLAEQQRQRKEKEEAARKARAEAAERGRQASKEWAEKQRTKLAAVKKGEVS
ncbi:hypothetical protein ANO11243_077110 [Dothideomycetidae sp. 11243]|nr:hypothetical protein ANO11243_077110 [fungal sp. No.11243]